MRHLQYTGLSQFNTILDQMDGGNTIIRGRLEAFSFKQEKGSKWAEREQHIPFNRGNSRPFQLIPPPKPNNPFSSGRSPVMTPPSPFSGGLGQFGMNEELRRDPECFQHLLTSIKSCFPFYSFRDVSPEDFVKEMNHQQIVSIINRSLALSMNDRLALWAIIEEIISVPRCEIYRYLSFGGDDDPLSAEGKLWDWNYFFYNRKLKRVMIFVCYGKNKTTNLRAKEIGEEEAEEDLSSMEEHDLFSDEDESEMSNLKNLDFYYNLRRIPSVENVDSFHDEDDDDDDEEEDDDGEDDLDDLEFDMSFL